MDNNNLLKEKTAVGVIVCRMQVPYLTDSHKSLVMTVMDKHQRMIIFLGATNKPLNSRNPYPFEFRKEMITSMFGSYMHKMTIVPLPDQDDNKRWVDNLDGLIGAFLTADESAILYGGRDSFIPYYKQDNGKYDTVELAPTDYDSGTELRMLASIQMPSYSKETARAILWTLKQAESK